MSILEERVEDIESYIAELVSHYVGSSDVARRIAARACWGPYSPQVDKVSRGYAYDRNHTPVFVGDTVVELPSDRNPRMVIGIGLGGEIALSGPGNFRADQVVLYKRGTAE